MSEEEVNYDGIEDTVEGSESVENIDIAIDEPAAATTSAESEQTEQSDKTEKPNTTAAKLAARAVKFQRQHLQTGVDIYSEEEKQKREARMKKWGAAPTTSTPSYRVIVDKRSEAPADLAGLAAKARTLGPESRREPAATETRRPEVLHLSGITSQITQGDIANYFSGYAVQHAEWLKNNQNCNVVFIDELTAKRALEGLGLPQPEPSSTAWRKSKYLVKRDTIYEIFIREATTEDKPSEGKSKPQSSRSSGGDRRERTSYTGSKRERERPEREERPARQEKQQPKPSISAAPVDDPEEEQRRKKRALRFTSNE